MRTELIAAGDECFAPVILPIEESGQIGYLITEWPAAVKASVATANARLAHCQREWGNQQDGKQNKQKD